MKVTVTLSDPEERFTVEIGAWSRMMFERHSAKHGIPPMPTNDAARQYPETYMAICTYYTLKKAKQIAMTFEEYEMRWDGIDGATDPGEEMDPTQSDQ